MNDISDIIMYAYNFAKTTYWSFDLFDKHWDMTFLQIWLIPVVASLSIRIVRHIYEVVNM